MRRSLTTLLTLLGILPLCAQIEWSTKEYDYGTIRERDGVVRGHVTMYNRGDKPVMVMRVKPSCGCTAAGFSEDVVQPGDSAVIWIDYDPAGRPGPFKKNVKVYLDDFAIKPVQIDFKGTVIGTPETIATRYPFEAGPLRLSAVKLNTGPTHIGTNHSMYIQAYNPTENPLSPTWDAKDLPVTIAASTDTVAPGDMMTFIVYYNSRQDRVWGAASRQFLIYPTGPDGVEPVAITLESELTPDPAAYSAQDMANAPIIQMKNDLTDLGTLKEGQQQIKVEFELENVGKSLLQIPRVYSLCEGVSVKRIPLRLQPGKKGKVSLMVYPELLEAGPFHIKIEICSNDPVHPFITHRIVGIKP